VKAQLLTSVHHIFTNQRFLSHCLMLGVCWWS